MIKCDNCSNSADYTHAEQGVTSVNYCASCLPNWLLARAQAGEFPLVTKLVEDAPVAEPKSSAKKKKTQEAEAPAEEAPAPVEEAPADESN